VYDTIIHSLHPLQLPTRNDEIHLTPTIQQILDKLVTKFSNFIFSVHNFLGVNRLMNNITLKCMHKIHLLVIYNIIYRYLYTTYI